MDRTTIIGFILIAGVLMVWIWLNAPQPTANKQAGRDSLAQHVNVTDSISQREGLPNAVQQNTTDSLGKYFSRLTKGKEEVFVINTKLVSAQITSKGGAIRSWILKDYKTWNGYPVNLVNENVQSDLNLLFYTYDGKLINTKHIDFQPTINQGKEINIEDKDSANISFVIAVGPNSRIVKTYTFFKDKYSFDVSYFFEGMDSIISNFEYQVIWESGLRYQERNSIDESSFALGYSYAGGELTEIDASAVETPVKENISGRVKWIATRNKYFGLAIFSRDTESHGAYLEGKRQHMPNSGAQEYYSIGLKMPFLGKKAEEYRFTTFLGPLDFDIIKGLNIELDHIMSLGAAWIIRPISEYMMIPLFKFLHLFIPNYGLVIVVFSLIIKVILHPLTKSSMTSMKRMQALQPMIEEIREKHKDDPQKMNIQVMRLYKEYGVNPAGGCLPMLLQLPILYALWSVFRSTIELRQAAFVGWIHDLSVPDIIATLPFSLPLFNITEVSGLAILMGITMFIQQKMTIKDPRQKMMVWLMPILMTLLFNSFPSGLNLYYFIFNLLSIGQQQWINKSHKDEPLKKVEAKKSGGIFARLAKDLPKLK